MSILSYMDYQLPLLPSIVMEQHRFSNTIDKWPIIDIQSGTRETDGFEKNHRSLVYFIENVY